MIIDRVINSTMFIPTSSDAVICAVFKTKLLTNDDSAVGYLLKLQPYLLSPQGATLSGKMRLIFDHLSSSTHREFFDSVGLCTVAEIKQLFRIRWLEAQNCGWYDWVICFQPAELVWIETFIRESSHYSRTRPDASIVALYTQMPKHYAAILPLLAPLAAARWQQWMKEFEDDKLVHDTSIDYLYEKYSFKFATNLSIGVLSSSERKLFEHPEFPMRALQDRSGYESLYFNILRFNVWPVAASAAQIRDWKGQVIARCALETIVRWSSDPSRLALMQRWRF